ncbi:hypothetical protein B7R54_08625 [Subtercola boreus]|uniref:HTH tetR-type domain-containing protein n=1 Tax=Subtercola boreus TaxID=120213 RepID=A0A3E0VI21_9MICO|nr:TetR/AcrR family transcriptional regulator [Subtercola boreus]RFA09285.1 hypothetical protein B7R54_08625 [Subtercola boreus]TQL53687.1 TetR family transcriptional regulator [Subtercola boreus]
MSRWEPNTLERLQDAAMTLFQERGYANVPIADITERAGLTKRSFFNHFPDKREVLFAGAAELEATVTRYLADADDEREPLDVAIAALVMAGRSLAKYSDFARLRAQVIASSSELQERSLIKTESLAGAMAAALQSRQVSPRTAQLIARTAVTVFTTAYGEWSERPTADFDTLMRDVLAELTEALRPT